MHHEFEELKAGEVSFGADSCYLDFPTPAVKAEGIPPYILHKLAPIKQKAFFRLSTSISPDTELLTLTGILTHGSKFAGTCN